MKKILFIGHDASRTGAPILLLNIIKWFSENTNLHISILLKNTGELYEDYSEFSHPFLWNDNSRYPNNFFERLKYKIFTKNYKSRLLNKLKSQGYDYVYANTIDCLDLLELLNCKNSKSIVHVHELEYAIKIGLTNKSIKDYDKFVTRYITVSNAVKQNLIKNHNIYENKIKTIYAFPLPKLVDKTIYVAKKELKITNKNFIVGNIGRVDWLKGVDMFIQLSNIIAKYNLPIVLCWIGHLSAEMKIQVEIEIDKYNLNNILFPGSKVNSFDYYQVFDVFLTTSRQDSFPLVVLEAAYNQLPIFCFEDCGGASEFIDNNINGKIIPYGEIQNLANEIIFLYKNKTVAKEMGLKSKDKIKNYTIENTCCQIKNLIENL